jgi:hypothetical protein
MPKYFATVAYYRIETLIVEAENEEEAEEAAHDLVRNDDTDVQDISLTPFCYGKPQEDPEEG